MRRLYRFLTVRRRLNDYDQYPITEMMIHGNKIDRLNYWYEFIIIQISGYIDLRNCKSDTVIIRAMYVYIYYSSSTINPCSLRIPSKGITWCLFATGLFFSGSTKLQNAINPPNNAKTTPHVPKT